MKGEWIKQKLKKVLIILCIVMLLFNFITPNYSHALDAAAAGLGLSAIGSVIRTAGIVTLIVQLPDIIAMLFDILYQVVEYILIPDVKLSDLKVWDENGRELSSMSAVIDIMNREKKGKDTPDGATSSEWAHPYYTRNGDPNYRNKVFDIGDLDSYNIPWCIISPLDIFKCDFPILNANYFNGANNASSSNILRDNVASWYNTFRIIAILGLLCVLLYLGIRIIISTTVSDKSKYKNMLVDWVVALCLIFCLNYIMSFTMNMVDYICDILAPEASDIYSLQVENVGRVLFIGGHTVYAPANIVGILRIQAVQNDFDGERTFSEWGLRLINVALYGAMIILMITFTITYIKRFFTLTFLTFISPLVALTYPLDKVRDGKAQAFNFWFREYITNAILPIIHIILYRVLIMSVPDLVLDNQIYALCAFAFFGPAKKIVDSMFGVKGQLGAPPSITGAAIAGNAFNRISGEAGRIVGGFGNINNKGKLGDGSSDIKQQDGSGIFASSPTNTLPSDHNVVTETPAPASPTQSPTGDGPASPTITTGGQDGTYDTGSWSSYFSSGGEFSGGTQSGMNPGRGEMPAAGVPSAEELSNMSTVQLMGIAAGTGDARDGALAIIQEKANGGDADARAFLAQRSRSLPREGENGVGAPGVEGAPVIVDNVETGAPEGGAPQEETVITTPDAPAAPTTTGEQINAEATPNIAIPESLDMSVLNPNDEKKGLKKRAWEWVKSDLGIPDGDAKHVAKTLGLRAGRYVAVQGLGKAASIGASLALMAGGLTFGIAKGAGKSEGIEGIIGEAETGAWSGLSTGMSVGRALDNNIQNITGTVSNNGWATASYLKNGGDQYEQFGIKNMDLDDIRQSHAFKKDEKIYKLARQRVIAQKKNEAQASGGTWDIRGNQAEVARLTKEKMEEWDTYRIRAGGKISTDELKRLDDVKRTREQEFFSSDTSQRNNQEKREAARERAVIWAGQLEAYKKESGISAQSLADHKKRDDLTRSLKESYKAARSSMTDTEATRSTEITLADLSHLYGLN